MDAVRFSQKTLRSLSIPERRRLENLTLTSESFMRVLLQDNPETAVCWLARSRGHILGWSLIRWFPADIFNRTGSYISVFVDHIHRGRGLGKRLVREAVGYAHEHDMKPWFYGASQEQINFYTACAVSPDHITADPFCRRMP